MNITLSDVTPKEALLMLSALAGVQKTQPDTSNVTVGKAFETDMKPEVTATGRWVMDKPNVEEQPKPELVEVAGIESPETVAERLGRDRKAAKTVTIDGKNAKAGDEVVTPDGEVGVIHACFRGYAVLAFEDGRGEAHQSSTLHLHAGEDEPAPEPVEAAPEPVEAAPEPEPVVEEAEVVEDAPATNGKAEYTVEDVRALVREVITSKGSAVTLKVMEEATGKTKISEMDQAVYPKLIAALRTEA